MRVLVSLVFFCLGFCIVAERLVAQEVTVAEYINWDRYLAHFVDASSSAKSGMRDALVTAVSTRSIYCGFRGAMPWWCVKGKYRYFQGVTGEAKLVRSGYACPGEIGIPNRRYYSELLLIDFKCVRFDWHKEDGKYEIIIPKDA